MDMCYPRNGWQLKKKEAYSDQFLEDKSVGPSHSNRSVPRLVYCFRLQNVTPRLAVMSQLLAGQSAPQLRRPRLPPPPPAKPQIR